MTGTDDIASRCDDVSRIRIRADARHAVTHCDGHADKDV